MNKIAPFTVKTGSFIDENITELSFVFGIYLTVLSQLMWSVSKHAFHLVRTETVLNVLFTQLALLLVLFRIWFRKFFIKISWRLRSICWCWRKILFCKIWQISRKGKFFFNKLSSARAHVFGSIINY